MSHVYRVTYEALGGTHEEWPDIPGNLTPTVDDAGILYFTTKEQRIVFMFNNDVWRSVERVELVKSVGAQECSP